MRDQASSLRELIGKINKKNTIKNTNNSMKSISRVITITSGKGGVGKTNFTINLAIELSKLNQRVTIIDADLGLGNIDVVLGLVPKKTLANVIRNEDNILDIRIKGPNGIDIISAGSGIKEMINLPKSEINHLINNFLLLNDTTDYILIDTGAGINDSVITFVEAANEMILVVTPEPTSITDAYAVIKNIGKTDKIIKIVVNRVENSQEGNDVFNKLNSATKRFLNIELEKLGFIYEDPAVKKSVKSQKPFVLNFPNCIATKSVEHIAYNLISNSKEIKEFSSLKKYINNLFYNLK